MNQGPAPTIRPYRTGDRAAVVALWRSCALLRPWNDPHEDIARCLVTPTSELLVAEEAGRIVASAMYGFDGHRGWVYYLAVAPQRARQGLGRQMMARVERGVAELGGSKVQLMIRAENADVRRFYERLGYATEERLVMARRLDMPDPRNRLFAGDGETREADDR